MFCFLLLLVILNWLLVIIRVILSVVYFTMLERKIMSYIQKRKGPNKVGILGLLTPIADALKLLAKKIGNPLKSKYFIF